VIDRINDDPALATYRPQLKDFMESYFLPTWVGTQLRRPVFRLDKWSHNDDSVLRPDGTPWIAHPKVSNSIESWHRTVNGEARQHGTGFWTILEVIKEELGKRTGCLSGLFLGFRHKCGAQISRVYW
jgi:hypothetical protein